MDSIGEKIKLSKDIIIQTDDPWSFENQKAIQEAWSGEPLTPQEERGLKIMLDAHNLSIKEEQEGQ